MLPIVIRRDLDGSNGRNWPGFVILGKDIERPAAVAAQEIWEARHKLNPLALLQVLTSKDSRRKMELMGHEVEVQACVIIYGQSEIVARKREAVAMHNGYDGLFRHMSPLKIEAEMRKRSDKARAWVQANLREIKRYH